MTKKTKCAYTDEQLSIILSAKAGKQLIPCGVDPISRPGEAVGCLNQVAFHELNLGVGGAVEEYNVGTLASEAACRFDGLRGKKGGVSRISYDRLLRICGA